MRSECERAGEIVCPSFNYEQKNIEQGDKFGFIHKTHERRELTAHKPDEVPS